MGPRNCTWEGAILDGLSQRLLFGTVVPWLGRSSADSWSSEAPAHTTSSFPLMRLLGAVHKGEVAVSDWWVLLLAPGLWRSFSTVGS